MSETQRVVAPYGEWESPIEARQVAGAVRKVNWPQFVGGELWWLESKSEEGGRDTLMRHTPDGTLYEVTPAPWRPRNRVHEYGGRPWVAVPTDAGHTVVFTHWLDHRIYRVDPGAAPVPLTPAPAQDAGLRYADLVPGARGEVLAVRERHTEGQLDRHIVAVPLDGRAAEDPGAVREVVSGSHFLGNPRLSPSGSRLAWLAWEHPDMPWDATELRVGDLGPDGTVTSWHRVLGGHHQEGVPVESVCQPEWADEESLYAVADRSGWWNLYRVSRDGGQPEPLYPREREFAQPMWMLGFTSYGILADGRIAVVHSGSSGSAIGLLEPSSGQLTDLDLPYTGWGSTLATDGHRLLVTANSPRDQGTLVLVDPTAGVAEPVRPGADPAGLPDAGYLPEVEQVTLTGPNGREVYANVYPPTNPRYAAPEGELPPYVVHVHGGPTARAPARLELEYAYFTSRGIGIVDVNYGGSSGYGREYRERLREKWGIVDVEDCAAAVTSLAESGRADPQRLAISGGSAGGWTVLASVTSVDTYACGTSYFGVAELLQFAKDTHDFESRYLDGLVGPLPAAKDRYVERAPLSRVDDVRCPVLLLQGLEDEVVPPSQSEMFRDALARKGMRHAYLAFEGEQHGFRKAETIIAAIQAELSFYGQVMGFTPPGIPVVQLAG